MPSRRAEAFSDGVIAILITVMVLELRTPHGTTWSALRDSVPVLLSYLLSFVYLGIYWNNHHHLFMATERVSGAVLWANLHLLFWLSLIPFATEWVDDDHPAPLPTAFWGLVWLSARWAPDSCNARLSRRTAATPRWRRRLGPTGRASFRPCFISWESAWPSSVP